MTSAKKKKEERKKERKKKRGNEKVSSLSFCSPSFSAGKSSIAGKVGQRGTTSTIRDDGATDREPRLENNDRAPQDGPFAFRGPTTRRGLFSVAS